MQQDNNQNINMDTNSETIPNEPKIINTNEGLVNGQDKCPKCGSTSITLNMDSGRLRCDYCAYEFEHEMDIDDHDISKLEGQIIGSGATDIIADVSNIVTLKCTSCGAEVVIDTAEVLQSRCHWCRNTLSINEQIPNGSVPDFLLPFSLKKEIAREEIEKFVHKRRFFAHPKFKNEFTTENILGVYLPYMVVDINAHASLSGQGEHLVRRYTVRRNDTTKTYYDADLYDVARDFDITIDDLIIESSADKLNKTAHNKTNNIINSILPFDTENAVRWNANYLKGFTSEKRNVNYDNLKPMVEAQARDIAKFSANSTLKHYDRGVAWKNQELKIIGEKWKAAYLPVWLYSYQQKSGNSSVLHYVAVNARTKETMGSVPIHMPKLIFISMLVEILGFMGFISVEDDMGALFLSVGFVYFFIIYTRYRNNDARHKHELETKNQTSNMKQVDNLVKRRTGLSNSRMIGANNTSATGQTTSEKLLDNFKF